MVRSRVSNGFRFKLLAARALLCMLPALPMSQAWATAYVFTTSGTSPDGGFFAMDVNDSGSVVGYQYDNVSSATQAFSVAGGVRTPVAGPAGTISDDLIGITNSGVMIGNYSTTWVDDGTGYLYPGPSKIFTLSAGVYSTIDIPGLTDASVSGISSNGRYIVGNTFDTSGRTLGFAFDTQPGGVVTQFGGSATLVVAAGVNNLGVVVGYDRTSVSGVGLVGPAWTYDLATGLRTDINVAGSLRTGARAISDAGIVSGYYYSSVRPAVGHAFTGYGGNLEFIDVPGASQTFIYGANEQGALVGAYVDVDGNQGAFLATPVPELSAAWLLGAGLIGLTGLRRRRAT